MPGREGAKWARGQKARQVNLLAALPLRPLRLCVRPFLSNLKTTFRIQQDQAPEIPNFLNNHEIHEIHEKDALAFFRSFRVFRG